MESLDIQRDKKFVSCTFYGIFLSFQRIYLSEYPRRVALVSLKGFWGHCNKTWTKYTVANARDLQIPLNQKKKIEVK